MYTDDAGELHNNARMGWGKAVLKWTVARHAPIMDRIWVSLQYAWSVKDD